MTEQEYMALDPLLFWPKYAKQLPIHARIAAKVLSAPATSGDVEWFFSLTGRILCKMRVSLTADHVNEMSCLNKWINANMCTPLEDTAAAKKWARVMKKYTTLSLELKFENADESSDEDDEL